MKKILVLFMVLMTIFSISIPSLAAEQAIVYKETITVTEDGGRYQVGFVNVEFKKNFISDEKLPATFEVQVYAENGVVYVEFSPDTPEFFKKVHIRVDKYNGLLYDKSLGKNIKVNINKQQILARHFSRYCLD